MSEMKFKENGGLDPVSLAKGYTNLDGDPPNSGENILEPEHVARAQEMKRLYGALPMETSMDESEFGGFLERPVVQNENWLRPRRTETEDEG